MAKKVKVVVKLQIPAGGAKPTPPVGPALGQHGINIGLFCTQFNDATKDRVGSVIPAEVTIFDDRSFTFVLKTPPASDLLKKAAKIEKGAGNIREKKAGSLTMDQIREIAKVKMEDLNAYDIEAAAKILVGTARSMGIDVKG